MNFRYNKYKTVLIISKECYSIYSSIKLNSFIKVHKHTLKTLFE